MTKTKKYSFGALTLFIYTEGLRFILADFFFSFYSHILSINLTNGRLCLVLSFLQTSFCKTLIGQNSTTGPKYQYKESHTKRF
jgi:hypothetical protein